MCFSPSCPLPSINVVPVPSPLKFNNRGILAMANSGSDTNKSQFFITYAKQPHLDGKYTIFGKVHPKTDTCAHTFQNSLIVASPQNRSLMAQTRRWTQWKGCP